MDPFEAINQALQSAQAQWQGCDWDTQFGRRGSNLRGLRSRQARLAAQATRGEESAYWEEVFQFLESVERDAHQAAAWAGDAVASWRSGDLTSALAQLDQAIALETRYRQPRTYSALRELILKLPSQEAVV